MRGAVSPSLSPMPTAAATSPAPSRADRVAGSLLGLALGDAVGFVVEARPSAEAAAYVAEILRGGRVGMLAHPGFPFGQYTDDTQLARELLGAIRDGGGWDPARFAERIAALVAADSVIGAGAGTLGTARRLLEGTPWAEAAAPAPYAGNGSAMRAGPLGPLFGEGAALIDVAASQSRVTHADSRCAAGAVAIAGAAALATRAELPAPPELTRILVEWIEPIDPDVAAAVGSVGAWAELTPERARDALHRSGHEPYAVGEWVGVSAQVVPSVLWSLYAFLRAPDDYWEAVCTAVWAGGDTDTLAAMTGSIAGARAGLGGLPSALLDRLGDRGTWRARELAALAASCVDSLSTGPTRL